MIHTFDKVRQLAIPKLEIQEPDFCSQNKNLAPIRLRESGEK